jgi:hypothetical protein
VSRLLRPGGVVIGAVNRLDMAGLAAGLLTLRARVAQ